MATIQTVYKFLQSDANIIDIRDYIIRIGNVQFGHADCVAKMASTGERTILLSAIRDVLDDEFFVTGSREALDALESATLLKESCELESNELVLEKICSVILEEHSAIQASLTL